MCDRSRINQKFRKRLLSPKKFVSIIKISFPAIKQRFKITSSFNENKTNFEDHKKQKIIHK